MSTVDADALCRQCSYNLRGLPATSLCPECATPIPDSLRSDELRYAPIPWLTAVRRGLQIYRIGLAASVAYSAFAAFGGVFTGVPRAFWLIHGVTDLLFAVAGILLTTAERPADLARVRSLIRFALCLPVLQAAVAVTILVPLRIPASTLGQWAWYAIYVSIGAFYVVGTILLLRRILLPIARRTSDAHLSRKLATLANAFTIIFGVAVVLAACVPLLVSIGGVRLYSIMNMLVTLAQAIWMLSLALTLRHLSRPIRRALLGPVPPPSPPR